MTLIAEPPDLAAAADGQGGELQRSVFLRIPLSLKAGTCIASEFSGTSLRPVQYGQPLPAERE